MTSPFSQIVFRKAPKPGARYVSGRVVMDEMFASGRLMARYWNPNGQVWPEMHYENLTWAHDQPADTFSLSINQRDLAGGYQWTSASVEPDPSHWRTRLDSQGSSQPITHGVIQLEHAEAGILVRVHTRLDGSSFVIRWLEIANLNRKSVAITSLAPFSGLLWSHRIEEHLPPDASSPFEIGYNHLFEWGREGDFWFEPLQPGTKTVNGGKKGRSGWGRPAFWARDICNGQTFVAEFAWGGNYEFELDYHQRDAAWGNVQLQPGSRMADLYFKMGLSGCHDVLRVLDAGETITTPAVHLGLFHDSFDTIIQASHDHVRRVVMPRQIPGRHIEIEANHRGYLCDRENTPDILKDIDVAASIGAEMYVIDAGWFGKEPNEWGNNVGDWQEGPWMAKGGGLKAVSKHAHNLGMKFGLWVEIEAAGANSTLKQDHPDWLLRDNGELVTDGRALDLTQPAVSAWIESEIERLIRTYELDMYRLDHNHSLQPSGSRLYQGFTEDLGWRYYESLYGVFDRLREKFPKVVFQNCAGGGGRLDWGTYSHFHNGELSDWMRMPRGLKILNGVTVSLPPEILLRTFGTEVFEHVLEGDLESQLRMCFSRIIFRGIAPSLDELTPALREAIAHYLDLYREWIRPVMADGLVFHHTPCLPLKQHSAWCALEYARRDRSTAVAVVFRTSAVSQGNAPDTYCFRPRGLNPAQQYRVRMDNDLVEFQISGRDLIQQGVLIQLEPNLSSELLLFTPA